MFSSVCCQPRAVDSQMSYWWWLALLINVVLQKGGTAVDDRTASLQLKPASNFQMQSKQPLAYKSQIVNLMTGGDTDVTDSKTHDWLILNNKNCCCWVPRGNFLAPKLDHYKVLRSLKTDKASGPDGIPPRFLKEFADELAPVLCRLFRLILISCTYPSSWKHALVQPVPKKGDRSNPSNYRPIALTSAIAKVFETLLNSHFIKHLESNNLLSDHQYGFRKARSTGDLLSYLTHVWSSSLKNFGESFVVALDISKAFDRVWHKALLAKLPAYGFTPSFCKLISNFLSNRFISVVVDGATSASFPVSSGVPQGSVLSPTLFLLFINDLLHATASDVHSFADDSNLHKSSSFQCQPSSNARSQSRLAMSSTINSDLQSISEWGTRNLVKFNTSKTQLLTISLSNTPSNYPIIFEDSEIPSLNSVNILGLQISSSLSWRDHIVQIAKSASKKLGVLFRCKQYFNSDQLFKLYTGFIRPCLEYCSHICGSSPYTSLLDRIESKAIRLIGDPSLTSTLDPLSLRRKVASLSLFYRYYFGHCSDELATCIPPPMARPRSTRQATFAHNYCVELSNARINRFSDGFFPSTSHLWNSLPSSVFPASFNLPSFKRQVYHHLRGQMAWFFFFFITLFRCFLLTLFRYFIQLFYYTSFPFFKGCRLEKGHIVPVLCSHS